MGEGEEGGRTVTGQQYLAPRAVVVTLPRIGERKYINI